MTAVPPFESVLVANRGEIAVRIIRTLRRLGIRSIAVYSDADADAPHTTLADVAVRIGPAPARDSYLSVDAIMAAVRTTGAQAVHPGYGFVSESAPLAQACSDAGVVFVGPPVFALDLMGDKIRAKNHVQERGVPVIPGASRPALGDAELIEAARSVGFPLLVKPSAGGGGKGMQVVEDPAHLPDALAAARRIAKAAFGDDALLLERLVTSPRHIEVQILADMSGGVVHLGERECSLQRRHQKVIEEAPSPLLQSPQGAHLRERMGAAACEVARGSGYVGAGTVEFLVSAESPDEFFFMEMNARLQVEHPVTEEVARVRGERVDLVEQQLRIAAGEPLGFSQEDVTLSGSAVEARIYAEDPRHGFLPSTGVVVALHEPAGEGVRVDSGLALGRSITADYDPLLAKVIARGDDRAQALYRLDRALAETLVLGVHHNVEFLRVLLADPDVRSGSLDTDLIARFLPRHEFGVPDAVALDTAASLFCGRVDGAEPWRRRDGWRLGEHRPAVVTIDDGDEWRSVAVPQSVSVLPPRDVALDGDTVWIGHGGASVALRRVSREESLERELAALERQEGAVSPEVRAPLAGTVVDVSVASGDRVTARQALVTIEAMKMEHTVLATSEGIVTIDVRVGDLVRADHRVATIAADSSSAAQPTPLREVQP
ncbi:acetyl/propionyl-CoA carboxylase subunit alpha [Salinibacterium hongtaonis]|uniref:biotin carboxylase n=1 Tax=Homoserinimonas hongtaonis TaxID=2079791 RepID=A0A2U1SZ98_9MICO|nr:biotin carboxylase N-terminal domain-containing protein [Salinibacterium hongtaonis]PWB96950.1 acetyl/propionyl-CoA carboxylase subunit alpha [Salinibacterium hongtaonis]